MSTKTNQDTAVTLVPVVGGEYNEGGRKNLHCLDPRRIKPSPDNERDININSDDMQELIASIKENGVKVPLMVTHNPDFGKVTDQYPDGDPFEYIVYAGNRRISAVHYLLGQGVDIQTVDCRIEKKVSVEEQLLMQLVENSGKPFTLLEKAEVIRRLVEVCGYSATEVSKKTGENQATVSNLLAITKMPQKLKKLISTNAINASLALQIVRESDEAELTQKIETLETQAAEILASGKKKTSRALITEANVGNVVEKKKPLVILETVLARLDNKGIENEKQALLKKVVECLTDQHKNTTDKIYALFK